MPVLAWFISFTLSRRRVRLSVNWANTEWGSMTTESMWSETPCQLSQRRIHQHLRRFYHSALTQLTWSLTPRWLSWCGVSLGFDSVDEEWASASIKSAKKSNKLAYSRTKSKKFKSLIIWPICMCSISAKNENKKSHASVPLRWRFVSKRFIRRFVCASSSDFNCLRNLKLWNQE